MRQRTFEESCFSLLPLVDGIYELFTELTNLLRVKGFKDRLFL